MLTVQRRGMGERRADLDGIGRDLGKGDAAGGDGAREATMRGRGWREGGHGRAEMRSGVRAARACPAFGLCPRASHTTRGQSSEEDDEGWMSDSRPWMDVVIHCFIIFLQPPAIFYSLSPIDFWNFIIFSFFPLHV